MMDKSIKDENKDFERAGVCNHNRNPASAKTSSDETLLSADSAKSH